MRLHILENLTLLDLEQTLSPTPQSIPGGVCICIPLSVGAIPLIINNSSTQHGRVDMEEGRGKEDRIR